MNDQRMVLAQRSLDGLSVGDAFGERFFVHPAQLEGLLAARALPRGPWRWTDDTAMALSVLEVLGEHGRIDPDALARAFVRRFTADPDRGYGSGAREVLLAIAFGQPWEAAASALFAGEGSKGNGGAMRAAPIGAFFHDDLSRVVSEAVTSARVTHAHAEGQAGAVAVAVAAAELCRGARGTELLTRVLERTPPGATRDGLHVASRLPLTESVHEAAALLGTGRNVLAEDTVPFSLWCAARHADDSFEEAMWTTVSGLGDRDTTCAIVGGVVAVRQSPPSTWLQAREPLLPA